MIRAIITAAQAALPIVTSTSIFVETMCRVIFTVMIYHARNSIHQPHNRTINLLQATNQPEVDPCMPALNAQEHDRESNALELTLTGVNVRLSLW